MERQRPFAEGALDCRDDRALVDLAAPVAVDVGGAQGTA
jgi:hypothetical protein